MEIFNIHIFEFLLIAGLALVVFGPERLPEVGRFVGKQVARFLAWQQQSPELKMITDVRSEFEREIASLRDELVRTRKQLDISQEVNINSIREDLRPVLNLRDGIKVPTAQAPKAEPAAAQSPSEPADGLPKTWDIPPDPDDDFQLHDPALEPDVVNLDGPEDTSPETMAGASPPAASAPSDAPADKEGAAPPPLAPEGTVQATARPNRLTATQPTNVLDQPSEGLAALANSETGAPHLRRRTPLDTTLHETQATVTPARNGHAPVLTAEELQLLMRRLEALSADVQTLISGLQAQGVFGVDWEPDAALAEQESTSGD